MFSCLLEVRFAGVLLEGTAVSLLSDAENSGFDESASDRFREGVIERVCNASVKVGTQNIKKEKSDYLTKMEKKFA